MAKYGSEGQLDRRTNVGPTVKEIRPWPSRPHPLAHLEWYDFFNSYATLAGFVGICFPRSETRQGRGSAKGTLLVWDGRGRPALDLPPMGRDPVRYR